VCWTRGSRVQDKAEAAKPTATHSPADGRVLAPPGWSEPSGGSARARRSPLDWPARARHRRISHAPGPPCSHGKRPGLKKKASRLAVLLPPKPPQRTSHHTRRAPDAGTKLTTTSQQQAIRRFNAGERSLSEHNARLVSTRGLNTVNLCALLVDFKGGEATADL